MVSQKAQNLTSTSDAQTFLHHQPAAKNAPRSPKANEASVWSIPSAETASVSVCLGVMRLGVSLPYPQKNEFQR